MGQTEGEANLSDTFAAALGRIPSGLFIVTATSASGQRTGLLASWVQQASFEPPMLTVAINRERYLHDWLATSPYLGINVLPAGDKTLLKHFAAGFGPDEPAFEGLETTTGHRGVPLLSMAVACLEGRVTGQMVTGDHVIYAVELHQGSLQSSAGEPWVHLRKNGLRY